MMQATIRLVAPAGKREEFLDVLLYLKGPTEALPECRACWICQDAKNDQAGGILVQPVNNGQGGPAGVAVSQPLIQTLAGKRGGGMCVQPGRLVGHQEVFVFKNNHS